MKRREFLKSSQKATLSIMGFSLCSNLFLTQLQAASGYPLGELRESLGENDLLIVTSDDKKAQKFHPGFNLRTVKYPTVRFLCVSVKAVSACVVWCKTHQISFAVRGGGHCYEDFSQSNSIVIDLRLLNGVAVDKIENTASVGGGALLGDVYNAVAKEGLAFPAGTCPTVGIGGHLQGGGVGMLSRAYGLACDHLLSAEIVDASGKILHANASENADLFWAIRGGGGGSFGIVTKMQVRLIPLEEVVVFSIKWDLEIPAALRFLKAWQAWAMRAPSEISCFLKVKKSKVGKVSLSWSGQSIGTQASLEKELEEFERLRAPDNRSIASKSFIEAVDHWAGGEDLPQYFKAKSDLILRPIEEKGWTAYLQAIMKMPPANVALILEPYGGAISNVAPESTAFAHRQSSLISLQYYSSWGTSRESTAIRMEQIRFAQTSLAPFVSGLRYANYCDVDHEDWARSYWGENLGRLIEIKRKFDSENIFKHRQSIRL